MSVAAMTAVWRYSQAPDMAGLLILLAMADWADDEGYCFPSHRAIRDKTGGSASTVKRAIRQHIARGELERVRERGHTTPNPREFVGRTGFKPTNLYRIALVDQLGSKRPEFLERNQAKRTPVVDLFDDSNGGHTDELTRATDGDELGSTADRHIRNTRQIDTSEDTSVLKAGAEPRRTPADDDPNDNLGVLTKLAHEVLDLHAETADVTERDIVDSIELRCTVLAIASHRDVVYRAIESAVYQRRRIGKSAVLLHSTGEAAFRMKDVH